MNAYAPTLFHYFGNWTLVDDLGCDEGVSCLSLSLSSISTLWQTGFTGGPFPQALQSYMLLHSQWEHIKIEMCALLQASKTSCHGRYLLTLSSAKPIFGRKSCF